MTFRSSLGGRPVKPVYSISFLCLNYVDSFYLFQQLNVSNLDLMYAGWDQRAVTLRVPPIVHQSWKSCELLADQARWRARCERVLPANWTLRLYTDRANRELIRTHFPSFLEMFDGYD